VWEELCRVPLFLRAPGLEAGAVDAPATLLDVAPTLVELAGLAPDPSWLGSSLLRLSEERPVFLFECQEPELSTLAVVEGARKVIAFEAPERLANGELLGAFELALDPREERSVAGEAGWPAELLRRSTPQLGRWLQPLVAPEDAVLDPAKLEELRALGYGGD
jgi:choline-sulfatase